MGNRFLPVVVAFVLPLCMCACAPSPRIHPAVPAPDPDDVLAAIRAGAQDITSFRGAGKLRFATKGKGQSFRVVWIGSQPDNLRVEALGLWGQPDLTFLVRGKNFYLHDRHEDRCLTSKATAGNLERLVSIPLHPEDLPALFSGRVPVRPFHHVKMEYAKQEAKWCLCLYRKWGRLVERICLREQEKTVARLEVFDGHGRLAYAAQFEDPQEVDGVVISGHVIVSDERGHILSLEVEKFWTNVEVPAEAYTLEVPRGSHDGP